MSAVSFEFHKMYSNCIHAPWSNTFMHTADFESAPENINNGMEHRRVVPEICKKLNAKTYLEIGHAVGLCFNNVEVETKMSVDPCPLEKSCTHVMTSDDFFANVAPNLIKYSVRFDVTFIDGLHLFESSLRDFIGAEKCSKKNSVIMFHDCLPRNINETSRFQRIPPWTGDVYKTILALKKYRPDLEIRLFDSSPTGLAYVTGLDPSSTFLEENYQKIIIEFMNATYYDIPYHLKESIDDFIKHDTGIVRKSTKEILRRLEDCEKKAESIFQTTSQDDVNEEVRWLSSNSLCEYEDDKITKHYEENEYAKETRWNLWNEAVKIFMKHGIRSNLDIGCANNHFSYLCHTKNIISFGIDPRQNLIEFSNSNFQKCGIEDRYAFLGSIRTFNESFLGSGRLFDCVSVINFMHGHNHLKNELVTFFQVLSKCTKYIFTSEPADSECREELLKHFECVETAVHGRTEWGTTFHALYVNKKDIAEEAAKL